MRKIALILSVIVLVLSSSNSFAEDDAEVQQTPAESETERGRIFDWLKVEGLFRIEYMRDKAYPWAWYNPEDGTSTHTFAREVTEKKGALLRLDLTADVNPQWKVKTRLEGTFNFEGSTSDFDIVRGYVEGDPGHSVNLKLGAFGGFDSPNLTNGGFVVDVPRIAGGEITFGNVFKTKLTFGRIDKDFFVLSHGPESNAAIQYVLDKWEPSDYFGAEIFWSAGKWDWALGYHRSRNDMLEKSFGTKNEEIIAGGFDYHFNDDLTLGLFYSHGRLTVPETDYFGDKDEKTGYSAQLTYKKANPEVAGSFGTWLAYRHIGSFSSLYPTFDGVQLGFKGVELGLDYVLAPRVMAKLVGMWGKTVGSGNITQKARVEEEWLDGYAEERDNSHFLARLEYLF